MLIYLTLIGLFLGVYLLARKKANNYLAVALVTTSLIPWMCWLYILLERRYREGFQPPTGDAPHAWAIYTVSLLDYHYVLFLACILSAWSSLILSLITIAIMLYKKFYHSGV